jgi:hypothetical protein
METLKDLEALMDPSGNMRRYRQAIAKAEAPTIPFLRRCFARSIVAFVFLAYTAQS